MISLALLRQAVVGKYCSVGIHCRHIICAPNELGRYIFINPLFSVL
jgi:hypothetical protein